MSTIADLKAELEEGTTLNFISSAFTEASAAELEEFGHNLRPTGSSTTK